MKTKVLSVVVLALLLVGCSPISEGRITDKQYSPAYDYPVSYCVSYNDKSVCTMYETRYEHVPARWKFDIQNDESNGWVYVSEAIFDEYEIGEFYSPNGRR